MLAEQMHRSDASALGRVDIHQQSTSVTLVHRLFLPRLYTRIVISLCSDTYMLTAFIFTTRASLYSTTSRQFSATNPCHHTVLTMASRKIYIARHGERLDFVDPAWFSNSPTPHDPPLTSRGKQQATDLGKKLKTLNIKHVFTSPFQRCVNTASNAAAVISPDVKVHVEPGLCEWLSAVWYGDSEKGPIWSTLEKLAAEFPNVERAYKPVYSMSHNFDGFPESIEQLNRRCDKTYRTILEHVKGSGNVLLVGHGSSVESLIKTLVPSSPEEMITCT